MVLQCRTCWRELTNMLFVGLKLGWLTYVTPMRSLLWRWLEGNFAPWCHCKCKSLFPRKPPWQRTLWFLSVCLFETILWAEPVREPCVNASVHAASVLCCTGNLAHIYRCCWWLLIHWKVLSRNGVPTVQGCVWQTLQLILSRIRWQESATVQVGVARIRRQWRCCGVLFRWMWWACKW